MEYTHTVRYHNMDIVHPLDGDSLSKHNPFCTVLLQELQRLVDC